MMAHQKLFSELLECERRVRDPAQDSDAMTGSFERIAEIMLELRDVPECRKFQRIPVDLTVSFAGDAGKPLVYHATDFSLGGFRLIERATELKRECLLVKMCLADFPRRSNERRSAPRMQEYILSAPCQHVWSEDGATATQGVRFLASAAAKHPIYEAFDHAYMSYLHELVHEFAE